MKRALVFFTLLLATLAVQAQKSQRTSGDAEQAVANLEQQWVATAKAGNFDFMSTLLADNFTEMDSDGSMRNKPEYLGLVKGGKWEIVETSDVKVTVFGNTAVATGAWRGKGMIGGTPVDAHERFMDTWMKMPNGKWQCIASASTPEKR